MKMSPENTTSAQSSLEGYRYQFKVSVLFALDVLANKQQADQITLEPANEEDLEMELQDEPGALTQVLPVKARKLVVQCKLRSTGPWTIGGLASLLSHGKRRKPAKDQLQDPDLHYLLVTSADVSGIARDLLVNSPTQFRKPKALPPTLAKVLPADAPGRVAVWNSLDQERIEHRVNELLTTRFRVPQSKLEACIKQLEDGALIRMRGSEAGVWTREDVITIIERCGGFDGTAKDLASFVPPANWDNLLTKVRTRHAIVLPGPSGTGKTMTAKALIATLRDENPRFSHVKIEGGPERLRDDPTAGPVIYEIEDPWGKYRVEPDSLPWNDHIHGFLATASPDCVFVITSRSDVMQDANLSVDQRFKATLLADHYRSSDKRKLFENRLPLLRRSEQTTVYKYASTVVRELSLPLELDRFFSDAKAGPLVNENEATYIGRCIDAARNQSIESALIHVVKAQEKWEPAAVLWALVKARKRITFSVLDDLELKLASALPSVEDQLSAFASTLIAGGNFRQEKSEMACAHPRVEAGLEQAMLEKRSASARAVNKLLKALVALDDEGRDWGTETAAHVCAATLPVKGLRTKVSSHTQSMIDDWLTDRLAQTDDSFRDDLALAAKVGSVDCDVAEVARWLDESPIDAQWFNMTSWKEPDKPKNWYERLSRAPHTNAICDAFIRRVVAHRSGWFSGNFHEAIAKLSPDLTPSFCAALEETVAHGYNPNVETLIAGALVDLDRYEPVFSKAAAHCQKDREDRDREQLLALYNRNYDDEAVEHYWESMGEDGYSASEILRAYIDARRLLGEWEKLAQHPHLPGFLWEWIHVAHNSENSPPIDELMVLARLSRDNHYEKDFWGLVDRHFNEALIPFLEERLRSGSDSDATRTSATKVALNHAPRLLNRLLAETSGVGDIRLVELGLDMQSSLEDDDDKKPDRDFLALIEPASDPVKAAISALVSKGEAETPHNAILLLAAVPVDAALAFSLAVGRLLSEAGQDVADRVHHILTSTVDVTEENIEHIADAMRLAAKSQNKELIEIGLQHEFARVRVEAMNAVFDGTTGSLPPDLLDMHTDPSSLVRSRLVEILKERPDPSHIQTLLSLCRDTWTPDHHRQEADVSYPIAIEAIDVLHSESSLSDKTYVELVACLKKSDNFDVRLNLLRTMVRHGTAQRQKKLVCVAVGEGRPMCQRLTAQALFAECNHVMPGNLALIEDKRICSANPDVSQWLCMLISAVASDDRVERTVKALAGNPDRRVLIALFCLVVPATRSEATKKEITGYLSGPVVSLLDNINESGAHGDLSVLDELGDVRTVEKIKSSLRIWFKKNGRARNTKRRSS